MSNQRYPEEFKIQAVKQVTEKQLPSRRWLHYWACPCTASMPGLSATPSPRNSSLRRMIRALRFVVYMPIL